MLVCCCWCCCCCRCCCCCCCSVDFRNFIVLFWAETLAHWNPISCQTKNTSTINLFGFETLKLKIRRLKLWKPTVVVLVFARGRQERRHLWSCGDADANMSNVVYLNSIYTWDLPIHIITYIYIYIYIYMYAYTYIIQIYIWKTAPVRGGEGTVDWDTVASHCSTGNCLSNFKKMMSSKCSSNWEVWARWGFPTVSSPRSDTCDRRFAGEPLWASLHTENLQTEIRWLQLSGKPPTELNGPENSAPWS